MKISSEWFMGRCANEAHSPEGRFTSVRFIPQTGERKCWRCQSSPTHKAIAKIWETK